ncbi:MAG: hypothetical protein ACPGEG_02230 [Salibacteraceae bacterium]
MKKLFTLCLVFVSLVSFSQVSDALDKTQEGQKSDGHKKGDLFVMAGVGLGSAYSNKVVLPPILINVEYGFHDMLSVGAMAGFGTGRSSKSQTLTGDYHWNYSYLSLAGRASFHWGRYLKIPEELDLYGRVALGWRITTATWKDNNSGLTSEPAKPSANFGLIAGIHAGAKYMLTPALGAYLEVGQDNVSNIQFGIAFKL